MGSETVRDFFVLEAASVNGRRGVVQNLKDKYSTRLQQARPISKPFFTNASRDRFAETALLAESQKKQSIHIVLLHLECSLLYYRLLERSYGS